MIVMGIDPGTNVTGYGIIDSYQLIDYGCIRPPRAADSPQKRQVIFDSLCHLIDQYAPDAISVETQFVRANARTALTLGMVRGIAILAATQANIPVYEYTPSKAKKAVTGQGNASKYQVQAMVQHLLRLEVPPKPEDAADALALAICHINAEKHHV